MQSFSMNKNKPRTYSWNSSLTPSTSPSTRTSPPPYSRSSLRSSRVSNQSHLRTTPSKHPPTTPSSRTSSISSPSSTTRTKAQISPSASSKPPTASSMSSSWSTSRSNSSPECSPSALIAVGLGAFWRISVSVLCLPWVSACSGSELWRRASRSCCSYYSTCWTGRSSCGSSRQGWKDSSGTWSL